MPSHYAERRAAAKNDARGRYLERRGALLKAAADVFREKGVAGATLEEIAVLAGIDRASLYYYVSSKKELFNEVVQEMVEQNVLMAESIRDGSDSPTAKLQALLVRLLGSYEANYPSLFVFLQEDIKKVAATKTQAGKKLLELMRRFDDATTAIVQQGVDRGEFRADVPARVSAYAIIGMANWTHRWFTPSRALSGEELGQAFSTLISEGLVQHK